MKGKEEFGREEREMGGSTVPAVRKVEGRDKGFAPPFETQANVADYGVIGQPQDSMGAELSSTTYRFEREKNGDPNSVGKVKEMKLGDVI
jgi:hypothetical protein